MYMVSPGWWCGGPGACWLGLDSQSRQVPSLLCAAFLDCRAGLITSSADDRAERTKKPSPLMFVRMQGADPDLHNQSACKLQRALPQDSIWAHLGWLANHCLHQDYEHHCKANRLADAPYLKQRCVGFQAQTPWEDKRTFVRSESMGGSMWLQWCSLHCCSGYVICGCGYVMYALCPIHFQVLCP